MQLGELGDRKSPVWSSGIALVDLGDSVPQAEAFSPFAHILHFLPYKTQQHMLLMIRC